MDLFLSVPNRATDNKFLASIEGYRGNIYKLGRLLTHDWFTVTDPEGKAKERYLFLFKARILICKVKRVSDDRSVFVLKDIIKVRIVIGDSVIYLSLTVLSFDFDLNFMSTKIKGKQDFPNTSL